MDPLLITATAAVSAIGRGGAASFVALAERRGGLAPCDFGGIRLGHVGRVPGVEAHALPEALRRFDCRNNRLADMALNSDGFLAEVDSLRDRYGAARIAVVIGTSTSGIIAGEEAFAARDPDTGALPAGFDYPATQGMFSLAHFVRDRLGLRGPAMTVSTACASSSRAFIDAAHLIVADVCDAAIVGGADSLCRMTLRGFAALELISPEPCRPGDRDRAGISIGEAAGFVILERVRPASGAQAALLGYGSSSDGYHMSAPDPEAAGAIAAMRQALDKAGLAPADIDYINLHGTGTKANDAMEDIAVTKVFGEDTPCSSTKGWTGHTLGASGVLEAVLMLQCMRQGLIPGALSVQRIDPAFRANLQLQNQDAPLATVLSNAFGFGGVNCSLIFGAWH